MGRNGRRSCAQSGWQKANNARRNLWPTAKEAPRFSAWEKMLQQEGLTPARALCSAKVREWAKKNYKRLYVPPEALRVFGIKEEIV